MKFKLPKTTMFGNPIESSMERILEKERSQSQGQPDDSSTSNQPFNFQNANITAHDYVQIPQLKKVISTYELKGYNNMNWQDTHFKLHENGLYMPVVPEFMAHFKNVVESYKSEGKKPLFDAKGNPFTKEEVEDIYLHLTKDHITIYKNQKGAWTWLDASFIDDNGMKVHSQHRTFKDTNGNKILKPNKVELLETCLMKDGFVDFSSLNSQGFPTTESGSGYKQGDNIYFWHPFNGRVARFGADSVWADFGCDRDPSDAGSSLGVFGVVDMTRQAQGTGGIIK